MSPQGDWVQASDWSLRAGARQARTAEIASIVGIWANQRGQTDSRGRRRGHGLRHSYGDEGSVVFMGRQFEAWRAFSDMLAMYDLGSADGRELVSAAAELLVAGIDGPAVVELASEVVTPLTSPFEIDALVGSARDELGMPTLDADETAVRAALGN